MSVNSVRSTLWPVRAMIAVMVCVLWQAMPAVAAGGRDPVAQFDAAIAACRAKGDVAAERELLLRRAEARQARGFYRDALEDLRLAQTLPSEAASPLSSAALDGALGIAHFMAGDVDSALAWLSKSIAQARAEGSAPVLAASLNNAGNAQRAAEQPQQALADFREAAAVARSTGDGALAATAALADLEPLPPSSEKASALIKAGTLAGRVTPTMGAAAERALADARAMARDLSDVRAESFAAGYLGALFEQRGQGGDAARLTREAEVLARFAQAPESLYLWQWQAGRLARENGDDSEAIKSYEAAVETLQGIKQDASAAQQGRRLSFRQVASPLYYEFTDLLLRRAARDPESSRARRLGCRPRHHRTTQGGRA